MVFPSVSGRFDEFEILRFGEVAQLAHAEPVGIGKQLDEDEPSAGFQHVTKRTEARWLVGHLTDHRRQESDVKRVVREREARRWPVPSVKPTSVRPGSFELVSGLFEHFRLNVE